MKTKELLFGACLCMFTACNMPEKGMDVDVYEALDTVTPRYNAL